MLVQLVWQRKQRAFCRAAELTGAAHAWQAVCLSPAFWWGSSQNTPRVETGPPHASPKTRCAGAPRWGKPPLLSWHRPLPSRARSLAARHGALCITCCILQAAARVAAPLLTTHIAPAARRAARSLPQRPNEQFARLVALLRRCKSLQVRWGSAPRLRGPAGPLRAAQWLCSRCQGVGDAPGRRWPILGPQLAPQGLGC